MKAINIEWDYDEEDVYLPNEVRIPVGMTDREEISDYLSDTYGFCHGGFELVDEAETKTLDVTVQCMAVYNSSIEVPADMTLAEAIEYAKEHIDQIPVGEMEYISDSDEIDAENCCFDDTWTVIEATREALVCYGSDIVSVDRNELSGMIDINECHHSWSDCIQSNVADADNVNFELLESELNKLHVGHCW